MSAQRLLYLLASSALALMVAAVFGRVSVWAAVAVLALALVLAMLLEGLSYLVRKTEHAAMDAMGARLAALEEEHGKTAKTVRAIREQVAFRE